MMEKIIKSLFEILSNVKENIDKDSINISFFYGKYFSEYIEYYNVFIYQLENNPIKFLKDLYFEYTKNSWSFFKTRSFKDYINKKADKIEYKLNIELEDYNIPQDFYEKLNYAFDVLQSVNKKNMKDKDKIIQILYSINNTIKNIDFSNTNYSTFFGKLKEIILYTDSIQNDNLKLSIDAFFTTPDNLFNRNIEKETQNEKKQNEERYNLFKNTIIPDCQNLLEEKLKKILKIIEEEKNSVLALVTDEINNSEQRLKDSNKDLKEVSSKLEKKIKEKITVPKKFKYPKFLTFMCLYKINKIIN